MPRLHCPLPLVPGEQVSLPPNAARHAQVLRLQPGDGIELFHGGLPGDLPDDLPAGPSGAPLPDWASGHFEATITRMGRQDVQVQVGRHHAAAVQPASTVHLALGVPANERMDWLVEKAAELGAASIQPLMATRSVLRLSGERADKRQAHWQAVAVAACEQSGRTTVPWVRPVQPFTSWIQATSSADRAAAQRWVLSLQEHSLPLRQMVHQMLQQAAQPIWLLSGPEGGLSPEEEALALAQGFTPVSLGAYTLRAETAPLAALACLMLG